MASQPTDWRKVTDALRGPIPDGLPLWYQKHMTHHFLPEVDRGWLKDVTNCFLIREPLRVVASYRLKQPDVKVEGLGYLQQAEIFQRVADHRGEPPIVIDSKEMLVNPAAGLKLLCAALEIPFFAENIKIPDR